MRLTESALRHLIRRTLLEKSWADFQAPKGKTIPIDPADFATNTPNVRDLDEEIFDLIQIAYQDVELTPASEEGPATFGNIKIQSPGDLPYKYTIMKGADIDEDPDPDYFRGGKMVKGRFKLGIVGHDGTRAAIDRYLEETAADLKAGAIAEMSGKIAHIMITRHGVPAVQTEEAVEAMLGKDVDWRGRHPDEKYAARYGPDYETWYCRGISGACAGEHMKILLGGV